MGAYVFYFYLLMNSYSTIFMIRFLIFLPGLYLRGLSDWSLFYFIVYGAEACYLFYGFYLVSVWVA